MAFWNGQATAARDATGPAADRLKEHRPMMITALEPSAACPAAARGRRLLAGLALACAASLAWALPTPKDIEKAVNAGEYHQAETCCAR
jgi:hypothetical protein